MTIFKSTFFFLFILIAHSSFGQSPEKKVSIELSIPHTREFAYINDCSSSKKVSVIIHNNADTNYFYEDWNSYGYYNISFEIKQNDSIYKVVRPKKLWYRNFPSYYTLNPHASLVFNYAFIDTSCAAKLFEDRIFEDGWIGFPPVSGKVEIRAVYELHNLEDTITDMQIGRLNYRADDYLEYLEGDIESKIFTATEPNRKPIPPNNYDVIFHEILKSEWQKVIL